MGVGYVVACGACGQRADFLLGAGMLYPPGRDSLAAFDLDRRRRLSRVLDEHPDADISYESRLFTCGTCKLPQTRLQASITRGDEILHEETFDCEDCGDALEAHSIESLLDTPCWNCGQPRLAISEHFLWD